MMESWNDETGHDPELVAALRRAYGEPPEIDWTALHGVVTARAELPLARLRHTRRSPWAARFSALVPLAAAAGVVATVFALGTKQPESPVTAADRAQVEQILDASLPDVSELVAGQTASDQLLNAAIGS
jgi:hypothetical protein